MRLLPPPDSFQRPQGAVPPTLRNTYLPQPNQPGREFPNGLSVLIHSLTTRYSHLQQPHHPPLAYCLTTRHFSHSPPNHWTPHSSQSPPPALATLPSGSVNFSLPMAQHLAAASPAICTASSQPNSHHPHATSPPSILTSIPPTTEHRPPAASPPDVPVSNRTTTVKNHMLPY